MRDPKRSGSDSKVRQILISGKNISETVQEREKTYKHVELNAQKMEEYTKMRQEMTEKRR